MKPEKINTSLLIVITALLIFIAFAQPHIQKTKIQKCFDIAVNLERARHNPADNLEVTNQDISSFQKNMTACLAD